MVGIEEYKPYPCFVFCMSLLYTLVLTLNVLMLNLSSPWYTLKQSQIYLCTPFHTPFTLLPSLWMPEHIGVCMYMYVPAWLGFCLAWTEFRKRLCDHSNSVCSMYVVHSMYMHVVICKIDHCIHIHWCIFMGLGHNDPWIESHMWPQQMWGQRPSRGQWPLVQVFAKRVTVSTYFDVFSWDLDTIILG